MENWDATTNIDIHENLFYLQLVLKINRLYTLLEGIIV
jgi:hypothetical protein